MNLGTYWNNHHHHPPIDVAHTMKEGRRGRILLTAAVALLAVGCGSSSKVDQEPGIPGLQVFSGMSRDHVTTPVDYPQSPPVGGDHSPVPETCGAYDEAVPNENGVHSMEHGAVWITYRPDLPADQVTKLRSEARQDHVLVSPYPGLPSPVVASAWERQLRLDTAFDGRLDQFVSSFRSGLQTPEPGAACEGQGTPLPPSP